MPHKLLQSTAAPRLMQVRLQVLQGSLLQRLVASLSIIAKP